MSSATTLANALHEYLHGEEWQHTVHTFVRSNCQQFRDIDNSEYTHMHHKIWSDFREMGENVLGFALDSVGGSLESLEKALDEIAHEPAKGPKDANVKEILTKLLTFDNFHSFASMMKRAVTDNDYAGAQDFRDNASKKKEILIGMGFTEVLVDLVLHDLGVETDINDLVMKLSGMMDSAQATANETNKPKTSAFSSTINGTPRATQVTSSSSSSMTSSRGLDHTRPLPKSEAKANRVAIEWFSSYLRHPDDTEMVEVFSQALNVVDAYNQIFDARQTMPDDGRFAWANSMNELLEDIKSFCLDGYADDETPHGTGGNAGETDALVIKFNALETIRKKIEDEDVKVGVLSPAEQRRMAVLEGIAQMGTSDEQYLHSMITRCDHCQLDIEALHKKISLLVTQGGVPRQAIEELYLYLKEKINSGVDLENLAEEMHDRVYSLVESARGSEVVNILLEMHILEDEQIMLKKNIDELMSSPSNGAKGSAQFFGEDAKISDGNSLNADISAEADQKESTSGHTQEEIDNSWVQYIDDNNQKYWFNEITKESKWAEQYNAEDKDSKGGKDHVPQSKDAKEEVNFLDSLKSKHQASLSSLKDGLAADKAKKLKLLEDRLMRRQQLRKKKGENDGNTEDDKELEKEIYETGKNLDFVAETIISGFKKKCLYEMKACKKNGGNSLTDEDCDEAYTLAADNLKQRYVRDQKSLLNTLEAERERQRARLMKAMEKKRQKVKTQREIEDVDKELTIQLDKLDKSFEVQEAGALAEPQKNFLMALSALHIDGKMLQDGAGSSHGNDIDDEEDYLDEDKNSGGLPSGWLDGVMNLTKTYETAGDQLRKKLGTAQRICFSHSASDEDIDGDKKTAFAEVTAHMLGVISDAYCHQIVDKENGFNMSKFAKGDSVDMTRIKAGILEEFEKSRDGYQNALAQARLISKQRLASRKMNEQGDSEEDIVSSLPTQIEAMFEEVIDSFLDDPLEVPVSFNESKINEDVKLQPDEASVAAEKTTNGKTSDSWESKSLEEDQRDKIRNDYEKNETRLLDDFRAKIDQKKKKLKERLQKKKESKQSHNSMDVEDEDGVETLEDVEKLEHQYQNVIKMVESMDETQKQQLEVESLVSATDKMMKGENVSNLTLTLPGILEGKGTSLSCKTSKQTYSESPNVRQSMGGALIQDQDQLKEEVKRISTVYSEEKQKLDLMMKMQQTRQRQTLQRKLLERRQGWAPETENKPYTRPTLPGAIPFGGSRVATQPSFRGLDNPPMGEPKDGGDNSEMAARGLGLHVMRK